MTFGLTNAPATFQRLMEICLGDLNLHWCIIYLDDIVIFSKDLAGDLKRLEAVFQKLEKRGLKLKPSKCELFQRQLAYLGHVISAKGVATDEGKVEALKDWPTPTTVTEVSVFWNSWGTTEDSFLNSCRWYSLCTRWHQEKMQASKRLPLSGTAGVNRPLMTWRNSVPQHLFLCKLILQSHSNFILMPVASA